MAHVLVGFAEALPAPEVVFSLRAAGHTVSAFARQANVTLSHLNLTRLHVIPAPEDDAVRAGAALRELMTGPQAPDFVLPLDDGGLWLCNAALGEDPRIAGATGERARIALDKELQVAAAGAAGLAVPPTRVIRSAADLTGDLALPGILKPALAIRERDGRLGKGEAHFLADTADTESFRARDTALAEPFLHQPLIAGQGIGVFGFATAEGVVCWSGHERLRMMNPHGSGSSACRARMPDAALRDRISTFLAEIGWRGPFMVELLRDAEGTHWFMELNGRMWGSMALARRQGLEYPAWAVARAEDAGFRPAEPPVDPEAPQVLRHLGRDLVHLLFVLRGPKSGFHRADWPRFGHSLRAVLTPAPRRHFYNFDPTAPGYMWRDAWATVRRQIRR